MPDYIINSFAEAYQFVRNQLVKITITSKLLGIFLYIFFFFGLQIHIDKFVSCN